MKRKHNSTPNGPARARGVLRREVRWNATFMLEGSHSQSWRECFLVDLSRDGAGVELYGITPDEIRSCRIIVQVKMPRAVLHLRGDVRHAGQGEQGGLHVGLQFVGLSALERDMLESLLEAQPA
jgi:hypothetical protein